MSIADAEVNRGRQEKQIAARHEKEAEARPDAVHRALMFLLREVGQNNPDSIREVKHHMETLDAELADPAKVAEVETADAKADAKEEPAAKPDTAAAIKQSKRFKR